MSKVRITLEVDVEQLESYIMAQKGFNAELHNDKERARAYNGKLCRIRSVLGWNVLVAMERMTGKQIPVSE